MYTMSGFNWFDRRGTEGVGFIRALRTLLTNNLPQILPDLSNIIRARFAEMHERHPVVNGPSLRTRFLIEEIPSLIRELSGVKQSPVYIMITKLVVLSNAVSFFGKDLGKSAAIPALRCFANFHSQG